MNNKLSPKIKVGCSKCQGLDLDDLNTSNIKLSESRESRVKTIVAKHSSVKSSKVVSLF